MPCKLLVIRGAPGSGKSTIARQLVCLPAGYALPHLYNRHYEADMYFEGKDGYTWNQEEVHNAHQWCYFQVDKALRDGCNVIVSNTCTTEKEADRWRGLANQRGAEYQEMVLLETPYKNHHNVPEEKVEEYKRRLMDSLANRGRCQST